MQLPDGARRRLDAGGLLFGRDAQCDVVLQDARASRRQAMLYLHPDGPRVVKFGRGPTRLNGGDVEGTVPVGPGDEVEVPGLRFGVLREEIEGESVRPGWAVHAEGGVFGITKSPFLVGGEDDDLVVAGWPPAALLLHWVDGTLCLEPRASLLVDGAPAPVGELLSVRADTTIEHGSSGVRLLRVGASMSGTTAPGQGPRGDLPIAAQLEFLPKGGRLALRFIDRQFRLYLTGRRCDLIATLLSPPEPHRPGDAIPDAVLVPRVWADSPGTNDLRVLLHRVRKDLVRAGLDGPRLLARVRGVGIRFALEAGADVVVR